MNLPADVIPPPAIYHGCSTWSKFWEEKFTPVNRTSCGRRNDRKYREINNGEQQIILNIFSNLDCMDYRYVTSSEPKGYMGRLGKGVNNYLSLSTKRSNDKQRARFSINEITNQYFSNFLNKFKNSPYLG